MSRAEEAKHHIEDPAAYEHKDTSPKGILYFLGGLLLTIAVSMVGVAWLYGLFSEYREPLEPSPAVRRNQIPPPPRLTVVPGQEIQGVRAQEDAILETYGWENRQAGVVRIPIDKAMEILAQRGLPARSGAGPAPTVPETGAESGGPQTGSPQPRIYPSAPALPESGRPTSGGRPAGRNPAPSPGLPQGGGTRVPAGR